MYIGYKSNLLVSLPIPTTQSLKFDPTGFWYQKQSSNQMTFYLLDEDEFPGCKVLLDLYIYIYIYIERERERQIYLEWNHIQAECLIPK